MAPSSEEMRWLIEYLERMRAELKADMNREGTAIRTAVARVSERQKEHDRVGYMFYGAALAAWAAIEIGIKLLNV